MTFVLSEDDALKKNLQGMTVNDQRSLNDNTPRQVAVFYGQPDQEIREQSYPYVTIDLLGISRDPDREMRGKTAAEYLKPSAVGDQSGWEMNLPIPVNLDYQITSYARQPRHDRELIAQLATQKLPFRFGQLSLDDGTLRRLEVMGGISKRDATEQGKRLFVNAITVRISSEVPEVIYSEFQKVQQVDIAPIKTTFTQQILP
jgi:hypothetical protein